MRQHRLLFLALLYLVAVTSAVWGYAVARYEVFPYDLVRAPAVELHTFVRGLSGDGTVLRTGSLHPQEMVRDSAVAYSDRTGFVALDEAFVDDGYVLLSRFSAGHRQAVTELVRLRDFAVLHRWVPPIDEILDRSSRDENTRSRTGFRAQHPLLLENGSVVVGAGEGPLVRLDREGGVEWVIDQDFHHSIERDVSGNLVVPVRRSPAHGPLPAPMVDDGWAVVSPEGAILSRGSALDLLVRHGHEALLAGIGQVERDRLSLSDVQPVRRARGEALPGDLLLSIRNLSTVLLYRPSADSVVWIQTGPWLNQHDVGLLPNGDVSVFGNDVVRNRGGFEPYDGRSEVYRYDPTEERVRTPYSDVLDRVGAYTETGGRSRVLDNGDIFLEVHDAGQLFRLSRDGVRWVYVNGLSEETVGAVHWTRYYGPDQLDLSWLDSTIPED